MAGHSHWKTIKRTKEAEDKKRSKLFSKLAQEISITAREKGKDPKSNPNLRTIIEKAKSSNMPKEKIERAIQKGAGELNEKELENILIEAYGPSGIAIIIEGITDRKNQALMEIKQILTKHQGKLVGEGSVQWLFEKKIDPKSNSLEWIAKNKIELSQTKKEVIEKLFMALDEVEAVQKIYHNVS